jgi:predicted CoA-substrate-specific enzyme activase
MTARKSRQIIVGLDIGSLFVKLVILDETKNLIFNKSLPHKGEIFKITRAMIQEHVQPYNCKSISIIGRNAGRITDSINIRPDSEISAIIHAVKQKIGLVRQIIDIGGGSLSLIELDAAGSLIGYQTNTLCAAGTGSFLDEQAVRLGIDYDSLKDFPVKDNPPSMATRCAVFAKSDLIHRQQEGCGTSEMWSGLCKSMARTIITTLFKGKKPMGKTAVIGGVALNGNIMKWLKNEFPDGMMVSLDNPREAGAYGAALLANPIDTPIEWENCIDASTAEREETRPPLVLQLSRYPSFTVEACYIDDDENEVRITKWPKNGQLVGFIGIDVGSTSTKLMMINKNEEVILDIYRKTGGNPLKATAMLFNALQTLVENRKGSIDILGVGATGSGRKLVGSVIQADTIINEITAHLKGAMKVDPGIDTIFEIGGQDSKYIHAVHGNLHNANMNYVCAAGTGSFIEEVSRKTGFDLTAIGDDVMGVEAPITSDRCTVFMDQDIRHQLRKGCSPREVMGGILYSVVQNYMNKVVGNRYYSKQKIFFQGATARNKGLVAVFENLLGVEMVVSPYCHVMGSWGVALLTKQKMEKNNQRTRFIGLSFSEKTVNLTSKPCELCSNHCSITYAQIDGNDEKQSWGYLCGRDSEDLNVGKNKGFRFFKQRESLWKTIGGDVLLPGNAPVIYFPRALLSYSFYPFWRSFFASLGYRLELSKKTDEQIKILATDWVGADYCHPVKLAHGHIRYLLEIQKVDCVFVPFSISAEEVEQKTSRAYFCPYNMALPALIRSAIQMNDLDVDQLITATIDFRWEATTSVDRLFADLGGKLKRSKKEIGRAWDVAKKIKELFETAIKEAGRQAIKEINQSDKPAIVVLGRPYNVFDPGANLSLPEKIANLGFNVLPLEFLNIEEEDLGKEFKNMFWDYGRKILEASRIIARTPNLFAVYFNNFGCGPDSFIQTYVEEIMGEKPMLMLELDEHGADAGYLTRLEAFADVLAVNKIKQVPRYAFDLSDPSQDAIKDRTLWIPPMGEAHPELIAAIFRNAGKKAEALPNETYHSFLLGRSLIRGGECTPYPATIGAFIAKVQEEGGDPGKHALFMPTSCGPCRFGQYCISDRIILNRMGWNDTPIVSFTSENSYGVMDSESRRKMWMALVIGDILFKMRCRIKPYEIMEGRTEEIYHKHIAELVDAFEHGLNIKKMMKIARDEFLTIPVRKTRKPLVGIVGEIYVRNNRFINKDLVRRIEKAGGEAWPAPISEWIQYTAYIESFQNRYKKNKGINRIGNFLKNRYLHNDEAFWTRQVRPILDERHEPDIAQTIKEGAMFLPIDFTGEAIITLGRAIEFFKNGVDLLINCAPFGCMPGAVTSGIFQVIQKEYKKPVVNLFFDGEDNDSEIIEIYLANLAGKALN